MELGELICLPNGEPNCQECPFTKGTVLHIKEGLTQELPKKREKAKTKRRR